MGGCVLPGGGHYYSPSSTSGTPKRAYCRGSIGPENTIEFALSGAILSISANDVGNDRTHINILVYGAGFSGVGYDAKMVAIFDGDTGNPLKQTNIKTVSTADSSSYSFDLAVEPRRFEIKMPVVTLDGTQYEGLQVVFTYRLGMWPEVLNC